MSFTWSSENDKTHTKTRPACALHCSFALWSKSSFNLNPLMSFSRGTRLQNTPGTRRFHWVEESTVCLHKCPGNASELGCVTKRLPKREDSSLWSLFFFFFFAVGKDERVSAHGSVPPRRAGKASHSQRSKYHAFNRKARQLWRMSYLCRRGETSNRTAEAGQLRTASCVSREQQSTPKCVSVFFSPSTHQ